MCDHRRDNSATSGGAHLVSTDGSLERSGQVPGPTSGQLQGKPRCQEVASSLVRSTCQKFPSAAFASLLSPLAHRYVYQTFLCRLPPALRRPTAREVSLPLSASALPACLTQHACWFPPGPPSSKREGKGVNSKKSQAVWSFFCVLRFAFCVFAFCFFAFCVFAFCKLALCVCDSAQLAFLRLREALTCALAFATRHNSRSCVCETRRLRHEGAAAAALHARRLLALESHPHRQCRHVAPARGQRRGAYYGAMTLGRRSGGLMSDGVNKAPETAQNPRVEHTLNGDGGSRLRCGLPKFSSRTILKDL